MGYDLTRILVTGASGYLGQAVIGKMRRHEIDVVTSSRSGAGDTIGCDLTSASDVRGLIDEIRPACIVHLAANVPGDALGYQDTHRAQADLAMIDNLISTDLDRIIFASSMAVYNRAQRMPVKEEDAGRAESAYGAAKLEAEQRLFERLRGVTCLRFPGLFGGSRRSGLIYNAIRAFAARVPFSPPSDPPLWAAMHVEDAACSCVSAAIRPELVHGAINVGYAEEMSIAGALARLAELFGVARPSMTEGPVFRIDCTRQDEILGRPAATFASRLRDAAIEAGVLS